MRLSQSEHKIKQRLEQREITPSKNLWDNIQQDLDNNAKPKKKDIWYYRVASIAAVLCLSLLAYQGLTTTDSPVERYVIESKPIIKTPVNIEVESLTTPIAKAPVKERLTAPSAEHSSGKTPSEVDVKMASVGKALPTLDSEVEELLAIAEAQASNEAKQSQLEDEINSLLAKVASQNKNENQKKQGNTTSADLLLAEIEGEIDATKPPKFKDKVWSVLVANYNDMKQDFALN